MVGFLVMILIAVPVFFGVVALAAWAIYAIVNSNQIRNAAYENEDSFQSNQRNSRVAPMATGLAIGCGAMLLIPVVMIFAAMLFLGFSKVSYEQASATRAEPAGIAISEADSIISQTETPKAPQESVIRIRENKSEITRLVPTPEESTKVVPPKPAGTTLNNAETVELASVAKSSDIIKVSETPSVVEMGKEKYQHSQYYTSHASRSLLSTRNSFFYFAFGLLAIGVLFFASRTISAWSQSGISIRRWLIYGHDLLWAIGLLVLHLLANFFVIEILDFERYWHGEDLIVFYLISLVPFIGAYLVLRKYRITRHVNQEQGLASMIGVDILVFCGFIFLEFLVAFFFLEVLDLEHQGDEVCVGFIIISSLAFLMAFFKFRGFGLQKKEEHSEVAQSGKAFSFLLNGAIFATLLAFLVGVLLLPHKSRRIQDQAADYAYARMSTNTPAAAEVVGVDSENKKNSKKTKTNSYPKWVQNALENDTKTPYRNSDKDLIVPSGSFASKNEARRDSAKKFHSWVYSKFKKQYPNSSALFSSSDYESHVQSEYFSTVARKSLGKGLEANLYRNYRKYKIPNEVKLLSSLYRLYTMRESERRAYFLGFGFLATVLVLGSTSFFLRSMNSNKNDVEPQSVEIV